MNLAHSKLEKSKKIDDVPRREDAIKAYAGTRNKSKFHNNEVEINEMLIGKKSVDTKKGVVFVETNSGASRA